MYIKIIIFSLLFTNIQSYNFDEDSRGINRNSLSACILKIADNKFNFQDIIKITTPYSSVPTLAMNSKLESILLGNLSKMLKWSLITRRSIQRKSNINFTKKVHNYIIIINDASELNVTLWKIRDLAWNPRGRFIIVSNEILKDVLEMIVKILWHHNAINFIVLYPLSRGSPEVPIFSWAPYEGTNCGDNFTNFRKINTCQNGLFEKPLKDIFARKVPRNLHKCPVYIRAVIWPPYVNEPRILERGKVGANFTNGIEIRLINTVAQKLNFTTLYSVSTTIQDWGVLEPIDKATGLFQELLSHKSDIGVGALAATVNRYKYLDYSIPYSSESLTWCVPVARRESKWTTLIEIFNYELWGGILSSYFIYCLIAYFTKRQKSCKRHERQNQQKSFYNSLENIFLIFYQVFFSISVYVKPKTSNVRIIFISWVLFCLVLSNVYQSLLVNFLVLPIYEKQIKTVTAIAENDIPFGYLHVYRNYFYPVPGDINSYLIRNNSFICWDAAECLHQVAYARNISLAVPRLYFLDKEPLFRNLRGKPEIYVFRNDYISFPVQMLYFRGFPLLERIDDLISRIVCSGLLAKWERERANIYDKKMAANVTEVDLVDLGLRQLRGVFMVYLVGVVVATGVFLYELFAFKRKIKRIPFLK